VPQLPPTTLQYSMAMEPERGPGEVAWKWRVRVVEAPGWRIPPMGGEAVNAGGGSTGCGEEEGRVDREDRGKW